MKTDIDALKKSSVYAEEALVVDIQSLLATIMHEKGFNRAALAKAMGVSRARISQMFSDDCTNFTIRLLARALFVMGERAELTCETHRRVQLQLAMVDAIQDAESRDVLPYWTVSIAANDHGVPEGREAIEVAERGNAPRLNHLITGALKRADERRRAVA